MAGESNNPFGAGAGASQGGNAAGSAGENQEVALLVLERCARLIAHTSSLKHTKELQASRYLVKPATCTAVKAPS